MKSFADNGITPAALIFDTIFASDGVHTPDPDLIARAVESVRRAGSLIIADEVQAGFGRLGRMWGFSTLGVEPDIATIGKPMGSGQPIAAAVARRELVDRFGADTRYFSTFAANGVSVAAAQATLDVLHDEELIDNAADVGRHLHERLAELSTRHPSLGDVRGSGLFLGIDLVSDPGTRTPAGDYAFAVVNAMRERHVLVAAVGAGRNVLKIRPPMTFDKRDADLFLDVLDESLTVVPLVPDTQH